MTSTDTPDEANPRRSLWARLAVTVSLGAVLGALAGIATGDGALDHAAAGAVTGLLVGVVRHREAKRARRYRASFDPADRTLRPGALAAATAPIAARRHRPPLYLRWLAVGVAAAFVAMAVVASTASDATLRTALILWTFSAVAVGFVWGVLVPYTEVGADGLVVRTAARRHTVAWGELTEVRWEREPWRDALLICTADGRRLRPPGIGAAPDGQGEQRLLRLRSDIELAWSAAVQRSAQLRRLWHAVQQVMASR
ncbi:hypothetical protein Cs7R123_73930 [Catellatospora sp. TT07R-123]|uniref:PH domain-containing protein n=1 Tax=Catellatospora sp. TT07R-123 TaxID=2733863 RepID=UPI001B209333|nr:PH domain-containing protein [Catellatospora sp. TT07R-123]GHJ50051.1 hypothetical protein Cs7R123_73930 [Catellatospora sp. TT07R-123]